MQAATTISKSASRSQRWTLRRILYKIPIIVIDEYSLVLLLFLIAKWLMGERWEIVALGNSFLLLALLPTPILLVLALIRRRWSMVVVLAPAVAFFIISYAGFFIPHQIVNVAGNRPQLSILTYNIHSEAREFDPMISLIRDSNADVVAVQELSQGAATRFSEVLTAQYPYQKFHTTPGEPVIGQGVLSRLPILEDTYWRNESLPVKLGHQRVRIDVKGTPLILYNTHPIHPILKEGHLFYTELRTQEIQSVLDRANRDSGSVIIVGDFNMADQSDDYQRITTHYRDTYREIGWGLGFTFPDFSSANAVPGGRTLPLPLLVRLDYMFHSEAAQPLKATVWNGSGGSDHRPIFVLFALSN